MFFLGGGSKGAAVASRARRPEQRIATEGAAHRHSPARSSAHATPAARGGHARSHSNELLPHSTAHARRMEIQLLQCAARLADHGIRIRPRTGSKDTYARVYDLHEFLRDQEYVTMAGNVITRISESALMVSGEYVSVCSHEADDDDNAIPVHPAVRDASPFSDTSTGSSVGSAHGFDDDSVPRSRPIPIPGLDDGEDEPKKKNSGKAHATMVESRALERAAHGEVTGDSAAGERERAARAKRNTIAVERNVEVDTAGGGRRTPALDMIRGVGAKLRRHTTDKLRGSSDTSDQVLGAPHTGGDAMRSRSGPMATDGYVADSTLEGDCSENRGEVAANDGERGTVRSTSVMMHSAKPRMVDGMAMMSASHRGSRMSVSREYIPRAFGAERTASDESATAGSAKAAETSSERRRAASDASGAAGERKPMPRTALHPLTTPARDDDGVVRDADAVPLRPRDAAPTVTKDDTFSSAISSLMNGGDGVDSTEGARVPGDESDENVSHVTAVDGVVMYLPGCADKYDWMVAGEVVRMECSNVCLIPPADYLPRTTGIIALTNYRLHFQRYQHHARNYNLLNMPSSFSVPLRCIDTLAKVGRKIIRSPDHYCLVIHCKDCRTIRLGFLPELYPRRHVYRYLSDMAFSLSPRECFAWYYGGGECLERLFAYNCMKEYERLGISTDQSVSLSRADPDVRKAWRISTCNSSYSLCPTYPSLLVVPEFISDLFLEQAASFRSKGRLPVLTWRNKKTGAVMTRCSQPKVGPANARSTEDELLLQAILEASRFYGDARNGYKASDECSSNSPAQQALIRARELRIFDARPLGNAMANQMTGAGGTESTQHYGFCTISFLNIANIHAVRKSFNRLRDLCLSSNQADRKWITALDSTGWLAHISSILKAVVNVTRSMRYGYSVLVHCSDGWDRTAQVCSLSQLLLDGYYRSIRGFCVLIEKDWLSFGHKFADRCDGSGSSPERSPIFVQFLDCVWQLTQQFPGRFEFNDLFLEFLFEHLHSAMFGTFLFNCERERKELASESNTASLWDAVMAKREQFTDPDYNANMQPNADEDGQDTLLYPDPASVQFWNGAYPQKPLRL